MGCARFSGSRFAHPSSVCERGAVHCQPRTTFKATPLKDESIFFRWLRAQSSSRTVTNSRPPCTSPFPLCHLSSNLNQPLWCGRYCVVTCSGTGRFSRRLPWSRCSATLTQPSSQRNCAASVWALVKFGRACAGSRALGMREPQFAALPSNDPDCGNGATCSVRPCSRCVMRSSRARRYVKAQYSAAARQGHCSPWLRRSLTVNR